MRRTSKIPSNKVLTNFLDRLLICDTLTRCTISAFLDYGLLSNMASINFLWYKFHKKIHGFLCFGYPLFHLSSDISPLVIFTLIAFLKEPFLKKWYFLFLKFLNEKENKEACTICFEVSIQRKINFWWNSSVKKFCQSGSNNWASDSQVCTFLDWLFFFQQVGIFVRHQGWKNALQTCLNYPALLMMPAFSSWSFGASEKKSCCSCERSSEVGVSFTVTFINSMITLGGLGHFYTSRDIFF